MPRRRQPAPCPASTPAYHPKVKRCCWNLPLPRLPTSSATANRERSSDDIHIVGRVRAPASSPMRTGRYTDCDADETTDRSHNSRSRTPHATGNDRSRAQALEHSPKSRNRTMFGVKFRRQVPIGNYIADFCCLAHRLIVELDGGQHAAQEAADVSRSRFLSERGFRILRFWNDQVLSGSEFVVAEILAAIIEEGRAPSPVARDARRPLPRGEV